MASQLDHAADDDARFAQLIQDEFGVAVDTPATSEDAAHASLAHPSSTGKPRKTRRPKASPDANPAWFSLDKAIDEAQPDVEPFVAPTPAPIPRPRNRLAIAGVGLIVVAVIIGVTWLFGAPVPVWLRSVSGLLIGGGLACLLFSLPRHKEDPWDEGTVL